MSEQFVQQGVTGDVTPPASTAEAIGQAAKRLDDIAGEMQKARGEDTARFDALHLEQAKQAAILTDLKAKADNEARDAQLDEAIKAAGDFRQFADSYHAPSKSMLIGTGPRERFDADTKGAFLWGVHEANARDTDRQAEGKAILAALRGERPTVANVSAEGKAVLDSLEGYRRPDAKAYAYQASWGKATLGTSDATGGWVIPNAIVDEFIVPAQVEDIYNTICTNVTGVTAFAVDIPFRSAARTRAAIVAFGQTKENLDLVYNGYTATMYTLARIYDIGNQFLRQSRGAAEQDVLSELAAAFAQGTSYYTREGSGSSQPWGYTIALTNGPAAFRTTFSPSATTLAGSIATSIAAAGGALAGRGVGGRGGSSLAAVLSATSYWTMLSQGTDTAGFFFNPASGPEAINAPAGTLISPFGIPVYPDADADLEGTAAVIDNLVVGDWKKFKRYHGQSYRVDSSDQAGTRWDLNVTGFRGELEFGFDARPAVYAGYFQAITDIVP